MYKFYWLLGFAIFFTQFCNAQRYDRYKWYESYEGQYTSAGVEAGMNLGGMSTTPSGFTLISRTTVAEPRAGLILDQPLGGLVYLQPGIFFETVGTALSATDAGLISPTIEKEVWSLSYLHIPMVFLIKADAGPGKILFGLGAYYNMGLKAEIKRSISQGNNRSDSSYEAQFGTAPGEIKKNDLGITLNAGYEMRNGIFFRVGTDLGLTSVGMYEDLTQKNWCLHLSAGYIFRKRKEKDREAKHRLAKPIIKAIEPRKIESNDKDIKPEPVKPIQSLLRIKTKTAIKR